MTYLEVKNLSNNIEIVNSLLISRLYQDAKLIKDYEELNNVLESLVDLVGNLLVDKAFGDEVDWLNNTFANLHINVSIGRYIRFADDALFSRMMQYLGDGTGITTSEITNSNWYSNTTDPNTNSTLFTNNTSITSFNELGLLSLITNIPNNTFKGCTNLTTIDLHNITSIGASSFYNCSALTSADLSNCTSIGGAAFGNCSSLTNIEGLSNVTSISNDTFAICTSLASVNLSNITSIGSSAFKGCSSLSNIDLSNVTTIDKLAFLNCSSLTSIDLSNVTSISDGAFSLCSELTSINLSSCTSLGIGAFLDCTSLTSITLNSNLTTLPRSVFKHCSSLSSIDTSNITNLGNDTFEGCSNIQLLDLSSLTSIRPEGGMLECYTFRNCSSLTIVDLPNITQLPFYLTFNGCSNLRAVMFPNATSYCRNDYRNFGGCTSLVYVKFGLSETDLKGINQWSGGFFKNAQNLTVLDLGNTNEIDDWAIVNCTNIKAVVFRYSSVVPITLVKSGNLSMSSLFGGSTNVSIFVPDALVTNYQQDLSWSVMSSAIKPISTYNLDDYITSDYHVRLSL